MAIWGCGSPVRCCQPAVAGGFIYVDLMSELNTHLALPALFTQSSPVCKPLLQAFPFPSTLGEVTLHPLSRACMFIYSSHGKWVFPSLLWSFPAPDCWACAVTPAFSSQLVVRESPPPLWCSGCPALFATCLFCCYCLLFSFSFFPGWGLVCPGGYADLAHGCLWEYHVPLSSPCGPRLPKPSGCGAEALLVSPFNVKWRCYVQAGGVEESKFCLFSVVFPVRCISSVSPRFYSRGHAFCFLPLAAILESSNLVGSYS
jgi:hypothetical protein